uniref:Uncharacterized protein n=1 Tax=Setaria viridis TaxID=4556 RepID=A0A4U6VJI4_SETVI|nr:hypothetical protein SEVIR_3G272800v2 [Setaria viridis]
MVFERWRKFSCLQERRRGSASPIRPRVPFIAKEKKLRTHLVNWHRSWASALCDKIEPTAPTTRVVLHRRPNRLRCCRRCSSRVTSRPAPSSPPTPPPPRALGSSPSPDLDVAAGWDRDGVAARTSGSAAATGRPELALPSRRRDSPELGFPSRRRPPGARALPRRRGCPELAHGRIRPRCRELGDQGRGRGTGARGSGEREDRRKPSPKTQLHPVVSLTSVAARGGRRPARAPRRPEVMLPMPGDIRRALP